MTPGVRRERFQSHDLDETRTYIGRSSGSFPVPRAVGAFYYGTWSLNRLDGRGQGKNRAAPDHASDGAGAQSVPALRADDTSRSGAGR